MPTLDALQLTGRSDSHVREFQFADGSQFRAQPDAAFAFLRMREAAASERVDLRPASAFRSFNDQLGIWQRKWRGELPLYDAQGVQIEHASLDEAALVSAILEWSALPGASRHHWGSEFDVFDHAALPEGYRLKLLPAEYAPDGPFAYLTQWLDHNMARFGFYRPYDIERGGLHPEPWHLSYAPVAVQALSALDANVLHDAVSSADLPGKPIVLARLADIHATQVCRVASAMQTV